MPKILIIEQNHEDVCGIYNLLTNAGYQTYSAVGISDGLNIAARYLPDVILCLLDEPEKEINVVRQLNENNSTEVIPLIIISCLGDLKHQRRIMEYGADDFILRENISNGLVNSVTMRIKKRNALKQILLEELTGSLENSIKPKRRNDHVLVKIGTKLKIIEFSKIIYISALKEYSKIVTGDGCKIIVRKSLRNWIEILPPESFLRIHRATVINIHSIDKITKSGIRAYNVHLKNICEPFAMSQRYANIMRRTFPS
ncbi:MAG: response regulator transcription factor [bacterium]